MPTKEMGKTSSYWDKRRLQKYTQSEKLSKEYINKIQSLYSKANKDVDDMLKSVYKNYSKDTGLDIQKLKELLTKSETKKTWKELQKKGLDKYVKDNYKSRITRLEQIKAQVYERAKDIYTEEELRQTALYEHVINDSYYKAIYNVQRGTGLNFSFNKIDDNLVNNLLSAKWSGKNYSQRIWTNTDILADEVSNIIGGSLLSGRGVEVTAKEIRDRFSVGKYYAERLARTEMSYYENQADAMAYEEMGVEEFVPVATLDNRTSQYCADIDGKHFKYSEMEIGVNYPPFHPNCRCTTRGYLGKEAEKLLTRRARNPITGETEVISNMTYNEWKKRNGISFDPQMFARKKETMSENKKDSSFKYKDVTKEWLKNATPNSHEIIIDKKYVDDNGIKHPMKEKEKAHLVSEESQEYKKSIWLKETLGGEIHNVPRITDITNTGIKTSTPDYLWNGEKWDLKTPGTKGNFENTLERFVKKKSAKLQAENFIIDYVNFPNKTDNEILDVINRTLNNPHRNWIKKILVIKDDKIIRIYSRK